MRIPRLATAEHWYQSRPLGVALPFGGPELELELEVELK
jgi:hypothetical protein